MPVEQINSFHVICLVWETKRAGKRGHAAFRGFVSAIYTASDATKLRGSHYCLKTINTALQLTSRACRTRSLLLAASRRSSRAVFTGCAKYEDIMQSSNDYRPHHLSGLDVPCEENMLNVK